MNGLDGWFEGEGMEKGVVVVGLYKVLPKGQVWSYTYLSPGLLMIHWWVPGSSNNQEGWRYK